MRRGWPRDIGSRDIGSRDIGPCDTGLRDTGPDTGSLAVEFVIAAPALLMVLALVFAYGRVAQVNSILDAGVRDAARSVTQARSAIEAQEVARDVVEEAFTEPSGERAGTCLDTLRVELLPADTFERGGAVTVSATCRYSMRDLWIPGLAGQITSSAAFTSQLDPNRGVRDG